MVGRDEGATASRSRAAFRRTRTCVPSPPTSPRSRPSEHWRSNSARALVEDDLELGTLVHSAGVYSSRQRRDLGSCRAHHGGEPPRPLPPHARAAPDAAPIRSVEDRGGELKFASQRLARSRSVSRTHLSITVCVPTSGRSFAMCSSSVSSRTVKSLGISAFCVDPGLVNTMIGAKHSGPASRILWECRRRLGTTPDIPRARSGL